LLFIFEVNIRRGPQSSGVIGMAEESGMQALSHIVSMRHELNQYQKQQNALATSFTTSPFQHQYIFLLVVNLNSLWQLRA
jgi:hypothetical protein